MNVVFDHIMCDLVIVLCHTYPASQVSGTILDYINPVKVLENLLMPPFRPVLDSVWRGWNKTTN
jgi:hypothetical protein